MAGPHATVICRAPSDGVIEIRRIEDVGRIERSEALLLQPAIQHLDEPPAQRPRLHHAAIEQHVRGTGEAARPTPNHRCRRAAGRLLPQKARQMPCHRRVGGIWQAELLQSHRSSSCRHLIGADSRQESVEQHLIEVHPAQRRPDGAADQFRAFSENRHGMLGAIRGGEQRLLRHPALVPQRLQLPGVDAMTIQLEPLLNQPREREIHVVAAEQNVIANRHALEREIALVLTDENQAEVRGAAADVADEHEIADAQPPPPRLAGAVDPRIAGGLRFFEQRYVLEARSFRRPQGELARIFVE